MTDTTEIDEAAADAILQSLTPEETAELMAKATPEETSRLLASFGVAPSRPKVLLSDLMVQIEGTSELVPLTWNPPQRQILEELGIDPDNPNPDLSNLKLRVRILKARRQGISTLWLALMFLDAYNNPGRRNLCVAHDLDSTESIFETITRFQKNLPQDKRLEPKRSNRRELYF